MAQEVLVIDIKRFIKHCDQVKTKLNMFQGD